MLLEHTKPDLRIRKQPEQSERPFIDTAQIKNGMVISEAMFSVFKPLPKLNGPENGEIVQIEGNIHYINQQQKTFHIVDSKGDTNLIKFEDVVGVEIK